MSTDFDGIQVIPVRTPTLPPATHTNTYIVGQGEVSVFDPASPWDDEQQRLAEILHARIARGERLRRIVLTHHHADHVGGALDLQRRFSTPEHPIPIAAHPVTAQLLAGQVDIDEPWTDGQVADCGGRSIQARHTPGHAPGHLVFLDTDSRALIAGDMVAGVGTILIAPEDGDLGEYLDSLQLMRELDATALLPAHGPVLHHAEVVLSFYIAHRHERTDQIRGALDRLGQATPIELAPHVYPELDAAVHPIAAVQILAHLRWMAARGMAHADDEAHLWSRAG